MQGQVLDNGTFIFPVDTNLEAGDVRDFITAHRANVERFKENQQLYKGDHKVLTKGWKKNGPDNRLVANLPHYIVDTYNGFFAGIPPKITLDDDQVANEALQHWNDINSFQDKLSEISKQTDIYGRSFAFCYQDEKSETKVAYASPIDAFMIYDDTVAHNPLAFVRYWYDADGEMHGEVYMANINYDLDNNSMAESKNPAFGVVPAVEFYANEERQGVFDNVKTLVNSLDKVLSQKANQIEYFDNAYLKILGMDLDANGDGKPDLDLTGNQIIYSPDEAAKDVVIDFISKPDGDSMQEHLIDRLVKMIHQIAMVPDLNDEAFAGNSSGVAMQYKLISMRNMAANKERKFTEALRKLYRIVFAKETVVTNAESWQDLSFQFTRNLPANLADEAQTASTLSGIVSKKTQLKVLSIVDDPDQELKQIQKEQDEQAQFALRNSVSAPDFMRSQTDDSQPVDDESEAQVDDQ